MGRGAIGKGASDRGWRWGVAAAIVVASAFGYAAASLVVSGRDAVRERTPVGAMRALVGRSTGRQATSPIAIPARGWGEILVRVAVLAARNRLMAEAGAVTFFTLLAIFPALAAIVSLYGLFADPTDIERLLDATSGLLPQGGLEVLRGQLHALIANGHRSLGLGAGVGLAAALWSANQGSKALFESLNVIYEESERRSYPIFVLVAFVFTLGAMLFVVVAMAGVLALPASLHAVGESQSAQRVVEWLRWPVALVGMSIFLACVYRFGPSRENSKWRWVTPGGGLAALSWIVGSFAFSWYVQNFGSFDRTYGSLGAIIGFMVWIWLSTLVVLVGAQLNSEMEHHTGADTTTGTPRPLGLRGATQADTVA